METLSILIFKMSLAIWISLSPIDQVGIMDALANQYSEFYQCQESKVSVFAHGDKAYFFFECGQRFTGGENGKRADMRYLRQRRM